MGFQTGQNLIKLARMKSKLHTVFLLGFTVGTLDILAAFLVYSIIMQVADASQILRSIASGIFGKEAYGDSPMMPMIGLVLHYCIAFAFAVFYFVVYPFVKIWHQNKIVSGLLYGVFVWIVMNWLVLELVFPNRPSPSVQSNLIGMAILVVAIGLPISIITERHYSGAR